MEYKIYRENAETGDLVLFSGSTKTSNCFQNLVSGMIERFSHSKYSHAGIVIKDPTFTNPPLKGLYLLESTGLEPVPDVEDRIVKFGVQLRILDEVVNDYEGKIFVRTLDCKRDEKFYTRLQVAHNVIHNKPYDDGVDYIKAALKMQFGNVHNTNEFFCSALCAFMYVCWEFLPLQTPWSIITPRQLGTENGKNWLLFKNCTLSEEFELV